MHEVALAPAREARPVQSSLAGAPPQEPCRSVPPRVQDRKGRDDQAGHATLPMTTKPPMERCLLKRVADRARFFDREVVSLEGLVGGLDERQADAPRNASNDTSPSGQARRRIRPPTHPIESAASCFESLRHGRCFAAFYVHAYDTCRMGISMEHVVLMDFELPTGTMLKAAQPLRANESRPTRRRS